MTNKAFHLTANASGGFEYYALKNQENYAIN